MSPSASRYRTLQPLSDRRFCRTHGKEFSPGGKRRIFFHPRLCSPRAEREFFDELISTSSFSNQYPTRPPNKNCIWRWLADFSLVSRSSYLSILFKEISEPVLRTIVRSLFQIISYDSTRGGISVVTEKGETTTSFLLVQEAKPSDSGRYTCNPSNAQPKSITVHVLNGE